MRRRLLLAAVAAFPLAILGWIAWTFFTWFSDDDPRSRAASVSCTEAMHFVDQDGLPRGARDAHCTVLVWLDTDYDVRFTISRTDLDAWVKENYPGTKLAPEDCLDHQADACAHIELTPPATGGAAAIDLSVRYLHDSTAAVDFAPFDV